MMKQMLKGVAPMILGLAMASVSSATPLIIDNFNSISGGACPGTCEVGSTGAAATATYTTGGSDITSSVLVTADLTSGSGSTRAEMYGGTAALANSVQAQGFASWLWGDTTNPGLALNLTNYVSFSLRTAALVDNNNQVMVTVYSPSTSATVNLPNGTPAGTEITIPFASFGAFNWASVSGIRLTLTGVVDGADVAIDNFQANVPEPATYALMGAGLLLVGALRRRK